MAQSPKGPTRTEFPGPSGPTQTGTHGRPPYLLGLLLFACVAGVFLPAAGHGFIPYDDPVYVTENPHVLGGITWENLIWAFRSTEASNWHPLTWISHMADCELFGVQAWGPHVVNVLLHAANALLLFVVLRRMTGATWRSLLVAGLFGLHPLRVESVAWVSERKDVLSTFFCMLTLWAYAASAERARAASKGRLPFLGLSLAFFALGLMSKSMLVTLPCLLVLLDFWPLDRWAPASARARWTLLAEKLPFFLLAAAASGVTLLAQSRGGAVASTADIPLSARLGHALIAYSQYIGKFFYPSKLSVFYPYFGDAPPLKDVLSCALLLTAITAGAIGLRKKSPYLLVGWLWFLGMLFPVIGLVQVGGQSIADRYTYLPLVGVFIMVTWGGADVSARIGVPRGLLWAAAGILLASCTAMTSYQLRFWRNGTLLFRHALQVTENNWVAHAALGAELSKTSDAGAQAEFQESARILGTFAETYNARGLELERTPGHTAEAIADFRRAEQIMPDLPDVHYNLGVALAKAPGGVPEAVGEFREAIRLRPDFAEAQFNLGSALLASPGGESAALAPFEAAVRLAPANVPARFALGYLLSRIPGREAEAAAQYEAVLKLEPGSYQARFNLGLLLSAMPGRENDAIAQFEAALQANPSLDKAREMIRALEVRSR